MTTPKPLTLIRPALRQPLNLSIADITETRTGNQRMRWPSDPETTARLNKVIRLDFDSPVPWWRTVIRHLGRLSRLTRLS